MLLRMAVWMQIQLSDDQNAALASLAEQNHRSKRMEVMAALDYYIFKMKRKEPREHDVHAESA